MQKLFYVSHDSREEGPYSFDDINDKVKTKSLESSDFVYIETTESWVPVNEFFQLYKEWSSKETKGTSKNNGSSQKQSLKKDPYGSLPNKELPVAKDRLKSVTPPPPDFQEDTTIDKKNVLLQSRSSGSAPSIPTPSTASTPAPKVEETPKVFTSHGFKFVNGQLQVTLVDNVAETVHVSFEDLANLGIEGIAPAKIQVRPGKATHLTFGELQDTTVGDFLGVKLTAVDKHGNVDTTFKGSVRLETKPAVEGVGPVNFTAGIGEVRVRTTKAGAVEFMLSSPSERDLDTTSRKSARFKPGPAVKFVVEEQGGEVKAGEKAALVVKAVDQYGNVDTNFTGDVTLKVSGSAKIAG